MLSRVEEEGTKQCSPRQGCAHSQLNKLLTVSISLYVSVSLWVLEMWPLEVAASPSTSCQKWGLHPFGSKGFCFIAELEGAALWVAPGEDVKGCAWEHSWLLLSAGWELLVLWVLFSVGWQVTCEHTACVPPFVMGRVGQKEGG